MLNYPVSQRYVKWQFNKQLSLKDSLLINCCYLKVTLFTEIPIGSKTVLHTKLVLRSRKINCRIFQMSCLKMSKTKSILITYNYAILLFSSSRLDNSLANLLHRLFTPQFEQRRPDLLP